MKVDRTQSGGERDPASEGGRPGMWRWGYLVGVAAVGWGMVMGLGAETLGNDGVRSLRVGLPGQESNVIRESWPGIGCWFWTTRELTGQGYRDFLDKAERHSVFGLLTTSIRAPVEVTDSAVHDQIRQAAEYARARGMAMVMDLDVRLARKAFSERYPDELQEIVRVRRKSLEATGVVEVAVEVRGGGDHYTFRAPPYYPVASRLLRVYRYGYASRPRVPGEASSSPLDCIMPLNQRERSTFNVQRSTGNHQPSTSQPSTGSWEGKEEIDPATVTDITARCRVLQADAKGVRVAISCTEADRGRSVAVLAAHSLFTPDVFAPHLIEFERGILRQYADVALAGACKDEWGFTGGMADPDNLWYSKAMAAAYGARRPGRDLVRDLLLMSQGEFGRESERAAAINHYMEMIWQRNGEVETAFYEGIKAVFGPQAMAATHPTWFPNPDRNEVFKNGLHWWASRRDLAQTDESTPFAARTALAKKWRSPVWYNMYYDSSTASYEEDVWRHALGGGRMNFHPLYPGPWEDQPWALARSRVLQADARIRLLNLIATAPVDCPVAVVFGHPAALNWAGKGFADVGMDVCNALWSAGQYADLIPSSEIGAGNLRVGADGRIEYGPQRYAAVVFYGPQFERPAAATLFRDAAAAGKTALFRIGEWTTDFEGGAIEGNGLLPASMRSGAVGEVVAQVLSELQARGIESQTASTLRGVGGFPTSMMPKSRGRCRLLDGTVILASGEHDVQGDPIRETVQVRARSAKGGGGGESSGGVAVTFDAVGVAAVRLGTDGKVEALVAGGLRRFEGAGLVLELQERMDLAMWREAGGGWRGALLGHTGPVPAVLAGLSGDWTRLRLPEVMEP